MALPDVQLWDFKLKPQQKMNPVLIYITMHYVTNLFCLLFFSSIPHGTSCVLLLIIYIFAVKMNLEPQSIRLFAMKMELNPQSN